MRIFNRLYLTIRLRAQDFYEVIESEIKQKVLHKNIEKRELNDCFAIDSELSSQSNYSICNSTLI